VAISANAIPGDIEKGLSAGFFRYVTKPIRVKEFLSTLDLALDFAALQLPASVATGPEQAKTKPLKTTTGEKEDATRQPRAPAQKGAPIRTAKEMKKSGKK